MTAMLDGAARALPGVVRAGRRPVLKALAAAVAVGLVVALVAWVIVSQRPPLSFAGWTADLDARPVGDGLSTTRVVVGLGEGERVVLTSIRNDGRLPVTVLGLDEERTLFWVRAEFRDRGPAPRSLGYDSPAAAKAAVTASSVTLAPGASADVLVTFDPPPELTMADGGFLQQEVIVLSVRYLGLPSSHEVPLLMDPLVLAGASTVARLEREGRFQVGG